MTLYSDG
jgi:hypothetical protein